MAKKIFGCTVPPAKKLIVGTVPLAEKLFRSTVPLAKKFIVGTLPLVKKLFGGTVPPAKIFFLVVPSWKFLSGRDQVKNEIFWLPLHSQRLWPH